MTQSDASAHSQATAVPPQREALFSLLTESVQDYAIFMLDPSGRVTTWNRGAERINGYCAAEILGQHFSRFYPEADVRAGKCEDELERAAREGRIEDENWRLRKDGSSYWANVVITALRGPAGELVGFAKVTRDLTERRRAEAARIQLAELSAARAAAEQNVLRLTRLQALTAAVAGARTPERVAEVVVRQGVEVLGAISGVFARLRADDSVELVTTDGIAEETLTRYRTLAADSRLPVVLPFRTGKAEWIETAAEFVERYPDFPKDIPGTRAAVSLPLSFGGRILGVVAFRFAGEREFPAEERAFLQTFAAQAAQSVDRAEVYVREVRSRMRLEALNQLTEALAAATEIEDVSRVVVERGMQLAGADICTLYSLDEGSRRLDLIGERGCNPVVLDRIRWITHDSGNPVYQTIFTGERIWIESAEGYHALFPSLASTPSQGPRAQAFWSVPLVAEKRPVGLLAMGFYQPRTFLDDERAFVETFTRHCTEALLRAWRLQEERAARSLAEAVRASLAATLRSIGDAVITTDAEGKVTLLNTVAEQLTGWSEAEARGQPLTTVFRIVNEQTRAVVPSPVDKVMATGGVAGLANHTVLVGKDGRELPIDDSGAPIRGSDGEIDGVVLVFRDVSHRKLEQARQSFIADAAAALAETLQYRETLAKVAELAVPRLADWCAVDVVDHIDGSVQRLAVAHPDPERLRLAQELAIRYPPDPNASNGVPSVLRTGRSELYREIPDQMLVEASVDEEHLRITRMLQLRSAMIVPLLARGRALGAISFVYAESGRTYSDEDLLFAEDLARRCAIAIDNARLYAAEQRARQSADVANRAKDEFLATISHELRTPLNAIMGWAKMMASANLSPPKTERAVETIERSAVAMAQLIEDLLDVSRIVSGKMRLDVQSVDLKQVVEAAMESVRPSAEARGILLASLLEPSSCAVTGDPTRLQQVIWNLLTNAVKFTPKAGRIEVLLRRSESWIELSVSDTGKGIDPQFLPYIFDPFRQENGGTKRARAGLGLGLAIAKQLVELHGGSIEARSEGEGRGATLLVRLPVAAVAPTVRDTPVSGARQIRAISSFERPVQLRGLRVLVVDDEEDARLLVKAVLDECGSVVITAGSVEEAMQVLSRETIDVLVSDIGMPEHDGYELIRRVRALPATAGGTLPAAALTAFARAEDRRRVLNAGYSMHIPKPVEPAELISVVLSLTRFAARTAG